MAMEKRTTKTMIYQRVRKIWRKVKINKRLFKIIISRYRSAVENTYRNTYRVYFIEEEDDDAEGEVEGEVEDEEDDA